LSISSQARPLFYGWSHAALCRSIKSSAAIYYNTIILCNQISIKFMPSDYKYLAKAASRSCMGVISRCDVKGVANLKYKKIIMLLVSFIRF